MSNLKRPDQNAVHCWAVLIWDASNNETEVEWCESEAYARKLAQDAINDAKEGEYAILVNVVKSVATAETGAK